MIRPLSPTAKLIIYSLLIGSWLTGFAVNQLWASRQSIAAYWVARLLAGVPAMIAGWPLLLAPGLVMKLWGVRPPEDENHPERPPKWRFGQMLRYAAMGAIMAWWGTGSIIITILKLLSGCVDPVLSWDACP